MPFELTPAQRRAFATRLMVQAPDLTPVQLARVQRDMERKVNGIPAGDLVALESMMLLADQGNKVAALMVEKLREHHGL